MRAVLVGLVGAVLAVGGAQAGECGLDGLKLVAKPLIKDDISRQDLLGETFSVVRASSRFKRARSGDISGIVVADIEGNHGRFVVAQEYTQKGMPKVYGTSFVGDDPGAKSYERSGRNRSEERKVFSGNFDVYGGPLAGMTLEPLNCN